MWATIFLIFLCIYLFPLVIAVVGLLVGLSIATLEAIGKALMQVFK